MKKLMIIGTAGHPEAKAYGRFGNDINGAWGTALCLTSAGRGLAARRFAQVQGTGVSSFLQQQGATAVIPSVIDVPGADEARLPSALERSP
ncbi:hypothetical protein JOF53_005462 [Crossiella equi]|uniref:Uncharacterized protein n=1 Tax=Crossiella equi TaxID=130796 RepID=A0ABS5ALP1_9PSEU|nr:hypothetical protein [Crossiella equi]MBP2476590.1 hypothetical protein [Crossiella equi]